MLEWGGIYHCKGKNDSDPIFLLVRKVIKYEVSHDSRFKI